MADACCSPPPLDLDRHRGNAAYRGILWIVLAINAAMFLVEIGAGLAAGSASLQADALDFLGDAANYAISLFVVGMALRYRASAALAKGTTMGLFGLWVIGMVIWHSTTGTLPSAFTMGAVGIGALAANAGSFGLLWTYRHGDANMRSAWICTRNDVLGNLAVLLAALGVFGHRRRRHHGKSRAARCGHGHQAVACRSASAARRSRRVIRRITVLWLRPRGFLECRDDEDADDWCAPAQG